MNRRPVSLADPDYRKMLFGFSTRFGTPPRKVVIDDCARLPLASPRHAATRRVKPPPPFPRCLPPGASGGEAGWRGRGGMDLDDCTRGAVISPTLQPAGRQS